MTILNPLAIFDLDNTLIAGDCELYMVYFNGFQRIG